MDPTVTFEWVVDIDRPWDERADAAQDLLRWLAQGGHAPSGTTTDRATDVCIAVTRQARRHGWSMVEDKSRSMVRRGPLGRGPGQ